MAEAPGTPNNTESTEGTRQLPPPPPYRILNKEYMAQQLPHLQEKAPEPAQVRERLLTPHLSLPIALVDYNGHSFCLSFITFFSLSISH